jgi:hypothetical protein
VKVKKHATIAGVGGLLVPIALALATAIANEAQTLLGLHLDNVALAIYLLPFLSGAAIVIQALFKLEAARLAKAFTDSFGSAFTDAAEAKPAPDLGKVLAGLGAEPPGGPPPPPPPPSPAP